MTKWEYSELLGDRRRTEWTDPGGARRTRKVRLVPALNELAQDGWEVVGYAKSTGDARYCLLRRAVP
jgi:hypothetical protein